MFGKSSGLSGTLRNLLAKLQREFDYPLVTAVRPRVEARVRPLHSEMEISARGMMPLEATLIRNAQQFEVSAHRAGLDSPSCLRMDPLSHLTTEVHKINCWGGCELGLIRPSLDLPAMRLKRLKMGGFKTHGLRPVFRITAVKPKCAKLLTPAKVHRNLDLAKNLPLRLAYIPFDLLPRRLWIRYRASLFKHLGFKADQVIFLGIVEDLPRAPLQLVGLEQNRDGGTAIVRINGDGNDLLGPRVWLLIQLQDKPGIIPIALKKEE